MNNNKNKGKPSLHFGRGGNSGWTSTGPSSYRTMKPAAAIRELIQNGLDAAAEKEVPARMRFRVEHCPLDNIPGIDSYRAAFDGAEKSQRKLRKGKVSDNAEGIIQEARKCMEESTCKVLHILDNGIGLDKDRMEAVLADGISVKGNIASGSFGNGHVSAFSASDLRYVLYGGLSLKNQTHKMICAGHVILASREGENRETLSKDGYFVNNLKDDMFDRYVCPENGDVPSLVRDQLDWIQSEWSTGSVVSIVGFNLFRKPDNNLREEIFRAAACNFFEAVNRGNLVIEFEKENGEIESLNENTLEQVLVEHKDQKRSSDKFLSGNKAYEAFLTLRKGSRKTVSTTLGPVEIVVRSPTQSRQVHLCRNGMWITDLPELKNQLGNHEAFNCVIPLAENEKLNRLIRKTEVPLHNELRKKDLDEDEKKQFKSVLTAIREKLKETVLKLDDESFCPSDILPVNAEGSAKSGGGKVNGVGTMSPIKRHLVQHNNEKEDSEKGDMNIIDGKEKDDKATPDDRKKRIRRFNRSGNQIQFQGLIVPQGPRTCKVSIVSGQKSQESEIRFTLDESIDVTSDGITRGTFVIIKPDGLKLNGKVAQEDVLRKNDKGEILGVMLGGLAENQKYDLEFDYVIPNELQISDNQPVVLKAEIMRRSPSDTETGK